MLVDYTRVKNIFLVCGKSDLLSRILDKRSYSDFFIILTFSIKLNNINF